MSSIQSKEDMSRAYCQSVKFGGQNHADYEKCVYFNSTPNETLLSRINPNYTTSVGTLTEEEKNIICAECIQYGRVTGEDDDDNTVPFRLKPALDALKMCTNIYRKPTDGTAYSVQDPKGSCSVVENLGLLLPVGEWRYYGCDGKGGVKIQCPSGKWCDPDTYQDAYDKAMEDHPDCKTKTEPTDETPEEEESIVKKVWFWLIIVIVLGIGGIAVWKWNIIKEFIIKILSNKSDTSRLDEELRQESEKMLGAPIPKD